MSYIKIRFTEWRDAPAPINPQAPAPVSEEQAAAQKLAALAERMAEVRVDVVHVGEMLKIAETEPLRERQAAQVAEMDNLLVARKAAMAAQAAAGDAAFSAMKAHTRVGMSGFQVIDEKSMTVQKLVDADGLDLPDGAVYGYEVIDSNPATPVWASTIKVTL